VFPTVEDILSRCELFSQLHPSRRQRLADDARICKFEKGRLIFRQGDPCPGVFVVGAGMVRIFKTAPNGKEHVLHIVGPGSSFAEVAAIGGFDCVADAEAIAPSTCALVPLDLFRKRMTEDHQLCLEMMTGLSFWVRHLIGLLEDIVLRDATGRIARFLLESQPAEDGTVKLPSLKRHVASHLNLTSETFSRTFGRLIEAGLIVEQDNNRVQLTNRERLRAISEGAFPEL
jgi:CRP/FNR family transcriptional regulator, dissimilatory nitrate respiration regulator